MTKTIELTKHTTITVERVTPAYKRNVVRGRIDGPTPDVYDLLRAIDERSTMFGGNATINPDGTFRANIYTD